MTKLENQIASDLLRIKAVTLRPEAPFTWASGLKSPIYTDNRLTIGYPDVRSKIAAGLAQEIVAHYPDVTAIGGVATAGIPHAALVANLLNLPLVYIRSKPKDHGQGRQIEGHLSADAKLVVIDDLLSTGGSVLGAVAAAQKDAAIFSYQLAAVTANFAKAGLPFFTLTNYTALIQTAEAQGAITSAQLASLHQWREDPAKWGVQF